MLWTVVTGAGLVGSGTGALCGLLVARLHIRRTAVSAAPPVVVHPVATEPAALPARPGNEAGRLAALAGLEILQDMSAVLTSISADHKHYSDSAGACPIGLSVDMARLMHDRGADFTRFMTAHGAAIPQPTQDLLLLASKAFPTVVNPRIAAPALGDDGRRDVNSLCAFRHAAIDAYNLCQHSISRLRDALYSKPTLPVAAAR